MLAAVGAALMVAAPASALSPSTFESTDGNLVLDADGKKDWCVERPLVGLCDDDKRAPSFKRGNDLPSGQGDDSFGEGTKEDTAVPTVVDGSIPPNKSDLLRFYVANENVGSSPFLYLAWVRANTLGSANMDFEFNKLRTLSSNGKTPVRSAGDMLITFDFAAGGNVVKLGLHRWVTAGDPATVCEADNAVPCWGKRRDLNGSGAADGSVNNGFSTFDPIANQQVVDQGFGEAAIDLTKALALGPGQCDAFGSAYLKSRSSTSFTAATKDFVPPTGVDINLCQPATVNVKKVSPSGTGLGGAVFELYRDNGTAPGTLDAGDTKLGTSVTDSNGDCDFAPLTGTGTIALILHEVSPPNGYTGAPDQAFGVTFTATAQTITKQFVDQPVPGRIHIQKRDDAGNALAGARFTAFKDVAPLKAAQTDPIRPGAEDTTASGNCLTGADGVCEITGLPPETSYWVVETTTPAGYQTAPPQYATLGIGPRANEGPFFALNFVDPRRHRVVVIVCHEGMDTLDPSPVTISGVTKTSLATPPAGFTQKQLCDAGGASFGSRSHGTLTASVAIPGH
jgi:hypothetical protein